MKKEKPIKADELNIGCLTCSTAYLEAPMNLIISPGIGFASVTRNGKPFIEVDNDDLKLTVGDIEKVAAKHPKDDWRISRQTGLHGETYQRQGKGKWVCIESNPGFA